MESVHFAGNNKLPEEIILAIKNGIGRIIIDSLYDLSLVNKLSNQEQCVTDILLRINPGIDPHTHRYTSTGVIDSKFGIPLIGEMSEDLKSDHFHLTGRYERKELPNIIKNEQIDIFLIPSIVPETFSYTTQEIMMMEMPLMVFNLGAPAERVSHYDKGYVIDNISAQGVLDTIKTYQGHNEV